ncbi:hypothetical protein [Zavarzinia compransoris]|uniref:Uncharacterized protein n=1 Tax=Zavarzinia compransoris TaxID=1264899 RepID=A0A317DYX7_9PROT|nr:hypothetical protein [Zavarzinia compransoris]PWR19977.1 hypothetical protein DKG75_16155 [Zavarzinia compransoris]TDP44909.1 hypothetical protein DES42_106130 [Zavarzinia compransoris]
MPDTNDDAIPPNLASLHAGEEFLRGKAIGLVAGDGRLRLHLAITEAAMDLADVLRQFETADEDLKVIQLLGMRTFNAFGASVKLALSGYGQNSALILRDVLETVFLIDYFAGDRTLIERWRFADKKRFAMYEMFSELAGHPTMKSAFMMRPQRDGDAVIGPFMETTTLEAVVSEMGRLAIQVGEQLNLFFPADWPQGLPSRLAFAKLKQRWVATFYPSPSPAAPKSDEPGGA